MGKTVKSRTIMSIASFLLCAALCLVANTSIPKIYESYKQKAVAQQAASQATHQIKKETPVTPVEEPVIPEEEPVEDTSFEDEALVYDVPEDPTPVEKYEEPAAEEPKEEEEAPAEDVEEPETEASDEEAEESKDEGGFFGIILSLITGIIEKITSLDIFGKIKDFIGDILKFFGIEL